MNFDNPAQNAPKQLQIPSSPWEHLWQYIASWKHTLRLREREIELMPFWKSFAPPFALVTTISLTVFALGYSLLRFGDLPELVPFQYNAANGTWEQANKSVLLFLPIMLLMVEIITMRLVFETFRYDTRLSKMLCWILAVVNLLFLITYAQIFSLVLPLQ